MQQSSFYLLWGALLAPLLASPAAAQSARDLFRDADRATRGVRSASYTAVLGPGSKPVEVVVRKGQGVGRLHGRFRITHQDVAIGFDGAKAYIVNRETGKANIGSAHGRTAAVLLAFFDHWAVYTLPRPFGDEVAAPTLELEGRELLDGVNCHRLYVEYQNGERARWWLGVDDHLPRQVQRLTGRKLTTTYRGLRVSNTRIPALSLPDLDGLEVIRDPAVSPATKALVAELLTVAKLDPERFASVVHENRELVTAPEFDQCIQSAVEGLVRLAVQLQQGDGDRRERIARIGHQANVPPNVVNDLMNQPGPGGEQMQLGLELTELAVLVRRALRGEVSYVGLPFLQLTANATVVARQQLELMRGGDPGFYRAMKAQLERGFRLSAEGQRRFVVWVLDNVNTRG